MNKIYIAILIAMCVLSDGCATTRKTDALISKILLPINITAAYLGSVGLHESGHALTALALGADSVDVDIFPVYKNDQWHLGFTTAHGIVFEGQEKAIFLSMGPTAQYVGHVTCRSLLATNKMPRLIQPALGWFDIFNTIGYYSEVVDGLIKLNKQADMARLDPWISWTMLGGALAIDLLDIILIDSDFSKRLKVLFGEDFYEDDKKDSKHLSLITSPGFLGIKLEW